jgi:hypothetical protein
LDQSQLEAESHKGAVSFVAFLSKIKDLTPLVAIVAALTYGLGWTIRYEAIAKFGVGPVSVGHEAAIATATALAISTLPGFLLIGHINSIYRSFQCQSARMWVGQLGLAAVGFAFAGALLVLLPLAIGEAYGPPFDGALTLLLGQLGFTLAFLCLRSLIVGTTEENKTVVKSKYAIGWVGIVILSITFARMFCYELLPALPESLGGLGHGQVRLRLKEPTADVTGSWIASDSDSIIVGNASILSAPASNLNIKTGRALRIPISRLVEAEALGANASP